MNKVILLGRLTKNPEIKFSEASQTMVAKFTLAVNRKFAKQGEERQADFINVVAWNKLAEFAKNYLKTGTQINICGNMQNRSWTDKNEQKHYITEVIAEEIYFADSKKIGEDTSVLTSSTPVSTNETDEQEDVLDVDDLPF